MNDNRHIGESLTVFLFSLYLYRFYCRCLDFNTFLDLKSEIHHRIKLKLTYIVIKIKKFSIGGGNYK